MTQSGERQISREAVLKRLNGAIMDAEAREAEGYNPGAESDLLRDARALIEQNEACVRHILVEAWVRDLVACAIHGVEIDGKSIDQWVRDISMALNGLGPLTCERCAYCKPIEAGFYCESWDTEFHRPDYDPAVYYCADAKPRGGDEP